MEHQVFPLQSVWMKKGYEARDYSDWRSIQKPGKNHLAEQVVAWPSGNVVGHINKLLYVELG